MNQIWSSWIVIQSAQLQFCLLSGCGCSPPLERHAAMLRIPFFRAIQPSCSAALVSGPITELAISSIFAAHIVTQLTYSKFTKNVTRINVAKNKLIYRIEKLRKRAVKQKLHTSWTHVCMRMYIVCSTRAYGLCHGAVWSQYNQGWQVSDISGLNCSLNQFKQSWQKGFCHSF